MESYLVCIYSLFSTFDGALPSLIRNCFRIARSEIVQAAVKNIDEWLTTVIEPQFNPLKELVQNERKMDHNKQNEKLPVETAHVKAFFVKVKDIFQCLNIDKKNVSVFGNCF